MPNRKLFLWGTVLWMLWGFSAFGADIALVEGQFAEVIEMCLKRSGIEYDALSRADVEAGGLRPKGLNPEGLADYDLAILLYNPKRSEEELDRIEAFVEAGGKVFVFYGLHERIAELLGVRVVRYLRREYEGQFSEMAFGRKRPKGLPKRVQQSSWNVYVVEPVSDSARVIATWRDGKGKSTGYPALVLSPNGVYMSHVLLRDDLDAKREMLTALIGHFLPAMWERSAHTAIERVGQVSVYADLEELERAVERAKEEGIVVGKAEKSLRRARSLKAQAEQAADREQYLDAITRAVEAQDRALEAYAYAQPSKQSEFRAVWIHSAYGVRDWGWKKSIKTLAEHGFNAIIPNMLWAGLADYESEVLPVSDRVKEEGDQIAECLKWGRKYGVEVHVWKVNYNLDRAPEAFVETLRAEGRLQKDRYGKEVKWLCPSHPANFELERASMLEVVRNYDVDGIHFDYIRYPGGNTCYGEGCRERFQEQTGIRVAHWPEDVISGDAFEAFQQWRQDQITRLVKTVSEEARRIRPGIKISAAVFSNWQTARYTVGQDWKRWVEEGYLDFVCPMDYTPSAEQFEEVVQKQVDWVDGRIPLYTGIGAYRIASSDGVIRQIALSRQLGADGFVLFSYTPRLGKEVLPALKKGVSSRKARGPHRAPRVTFELSEGHPDLEGFWYEEGTSIAATVRLEEDGRSVEGTVELRTLDDRFVERLGRVDLKRTPSVQVRVQPQAGTYRLVVRGKNRSGWWWWKTEDFFTRSRLIRVVSSEDLEAELAKTGAPKVEGEGLRVGILSGGYGSAAMLSALSDVEGLLPFFVYNLKKETLAVCQVLVIPQPKDVMIVDRAARERIRTWVQEGGGLLVTHDMVGYRWLRPILPEVCRGTGRRGGTTWKATERHPVTASLEVEEEYRHSYYDHITLEPGEAGRVVVVDDVGDPVVIVGVLGEGRYVAQGMATGLHTDEVEAEPEDGEFKLLVDAVRWLGR